jgi:hypothetical protein
MDKSTHKFKDEARQSQESLGLDRRRREMGEFIYRYRGLPHGKEDFFWGVFTVGAFLCWWMMGFILVGLGEYSSVV